MRDLLRCRQTLNGYCRDERGFVFICVGEACEHTRIRSARSDYVYPNSCPRDFQCSGFCQPLPQCLLAKVAASGFEAESWGISPLTNSRKEKLKNNLRTEGRPGIRV